MSTAYIEDSTAGPSDVQRREVRASSYSPSAIWIGNASSSYKVRQQLLHVAIDGDEKSGYAIQCVEYPAALSQGKTKEEAKKNVLEAISLVLEEEGKPIEDIIIIES